MISAENIQDKLGEGITPEEFIEKMNRKYRELFTSYYDMFTWQDHDREALEPVAKREDLRCAIIAGDWCGDVQRNLGPILEVMKEADVPTELFIVEKHEDFLDHFLTMGGRSVPKVIVANQNGDVHFSWGPRPAYVQEPMVEFKQKNLQPDDPEIDQARQKAYDGIAERYGSGSGYQKLIINELTSQLRQIV
ncbi:thioredoxin family protein [Alteribacillus sp. HJP-4]|uniref:thioredoxin family protein n=1 Tax=Alteribacillus sp. HJP-4 TaxID=2775394 RepID=UPI0035CD22F9